MAPQTLSVRHAHQVTTGTGVLPQPAQPAQPQEDQQASPFKAVQAAATPPLPRRPAALRTWDRWVKAAQASLARRRRSGASPAKASTPQHALSAAVSGCSSLEPAHSPSTVLELPSPGAGAAGQPRLLLHTGTLHRAPYWTPVPATTRANSASSGHADNTLHCASAGLLHMPAGQRACPLPRPPQPPAGLPFAHSPMPSLPYPPPGPPFMLRPSTSVLCPAASVLCPAASLAGAAAASIVNRVLTAAAHAAQQLPATTTPLPGPPPTSLPAALAHTLDLPSALARTLELPTVQEADTSPDEQQQQQQQQVCPLGLGTAGMAANLAAAAVGAANASSLPAAAADPLCTGALAIGASAAAIAAGLTFLQPPAAAGQQQAETIETSKETARSASGPPSAPLPSVQPEALAAVAEWGASTGPAGTEAEQLLQVQQGPAQPAADAGLSVCSFCGGERPCHAPCPLAVATAALQGLHLQGIYATGRFRVACFVGDKASSPASTPRGSPTCSPTASSHSLCSGLTPTSGFSSPMQAALLAAAAGVLEPPAAPAATPGGAPAATSGGDGSPPSLAAMPATGSSTPALKAEACAGQQLAAGEPHATAAAAAAAEPLAPPRSSNVGVGGVAGGGSQVQAEAHQQPQQLQQQQQQQLQEGIRPSRRHPSSRSLTGKLQRKGRFMVVEYNDLVDAAKAAAMVAMVSAGEEDGGQAAAKAAALDVVRDAAQTMQGGAGLPSCTSELNLADTGCLMQQLGPAPEPLGTPGPAPSLSPPSVLPASLYMTPPTDLGPQPAAAAAAAVAAAAVLDHAASSIAHAAISAATGSAAEAVAPALLAFESPDVQQRALAVLGWPGPMAPLEPQAGEAGSGEQPQPGANGVPPLQLQGHPLTPFLLPGAGPSVSHEQLPGSCSMQGRQLPGSYSPHGHLIAAHESAPVQLGHVAGPLASPAVGLAGRPAHLSALPLLHSPPRIGSARGMGRTQRSPDSPLCTPTAHQQHPAQAAAAQQLQSSTPTAPRAYRKGRFSIQELPSGSSKNVAQLATVASDAALESAAGSGAGTPRADPATGGSPAGTPRAASPAVGGSPAQDAGTPRATTPTRSSPAPEAGSPAGSPAGQVAEITALPSVPDAVSQVAAETAGGETAGMALVPLPMLGSSTQYAVIAVQPAGAETSGTVPETTTGAQVDCQSLSHMQPASFAISTPNSLTDLTDAASSGSGPEGPAGGTSPPPSPKAGAAAGQASGPAAVAVGRRTLLLPKPDGADIALPPEMQCKLAYESVHLPGSSTPGRAAAGSSSGSSSGVAGSSGGATGTPSSSGGGTGEPASAGSTSGGGSAAGSSAGSSSGAAVSGMGYALQPLAPPNPLLANASNRWLLHNNTRVSQRTPSAFLPPEASFYTPPSLLQLPGSRQEGLGPSPSMIRAASLGMGMGGASRAGEDVVSFAQWMQHGSCWFPADPAGADVQAVAAALAAVTAAADAGVCDLSPGPPAAPPPVTASVSAPVIAETIVNGNQPTAEQQVLQHHRRQPSKSWSWTGTARPTAAGPAGPDGGCSPAASGPAPFHSPAGRAAAPAAAATGRAAAPAGAASTAVSAGAGHHGAGLLPAATSISSSGVELSPAVRGGAVPTAQPDTRREGDQKLQPQQPLQVLPPPPAAAALGDAGCAGPGAKPPPPQQQQLQQVSDTLGQKDTGPQLHHTQCITGATLPGAGPEPGLPMQQSEVVCGARAETSPPLLARASAPVAKARKVGRFTIIDA